MVKAQEGADVDRYFQSAKGYPRPYIGTFSVSAARGGDQDPDRRWIGINVLSGDGVRAARTREGSMAVL